MDGRYRRVRSGVAHCEQQQGTDFAFDFITNHFETCEFEIKSYPKNHQSSSLIALEHEAHYETIHKEMDFELDEQQMYLFTSCIFQIVISEEQSGFCSIRIKFFARSSKA